MLNRNFIMLALALLTSQLYAQNIFEQQVAINTSGLNPAASAILDLHSTSQGILVPRMTTTQRNNIAAPAEGLLVYDNTLGAFFYYDGGWKNIASVGSNVIEDEDLDTSVDVEEFADEDVIRFYVRGDLLAKLDTSTFHLAAPGNSVFIGSNSGVNDDGSNNFNVAVGAWSLNSNTSGNDNIALGYSAMQLNNSGYNNVAIGREALWFNDSGYNNVALGRGALASNLEEDNNVAVGSWSMQNAVSGRNNVAIGSYSMQHNNGRYNVAVGHSALFRDTSGNFNTALGGFALHDNLSGVNNTAVGYGASDANEHGNFNVSLGYNADGRRVDGDRNVVLGYEAGASIEEGFNNVIIGYAAGRGSNLHSKSNCVIIGSEAGRFDTLDNKLIIENTNTDNPLIYGDFDTNDFQINGKLNIDGKYEFPTVDGTVNQVIRTDGAGNLSWQDADNYWQQDTVAGRIFRFSNVAIGGQQFAPGYALSVNGQIICTDLQIDDLVDWPDYVFLPNYDLKPLSEVEQHINTHGHLPGVPSATEIQEEGISLREMNILMMEKIEELTLHVIRLEKELEAVKTEKQTAPNH